MKKVLYCILFTIFSVLLTFLLIAGLELILWKLLANNLDRYGDLYSSGDWRLYLRVITVVLLTLGVGLGIYGGLHFWQILYVEKRYGTPRW